MVRRLFVIVSLSVAVLLSGAPQDEVTLLRWVGPPGSRPGTFREWLSSHPYTDFSYRLDKMVTGNEKAGTVAIITQQSIAPSLTDEIDQLINNLQQEGYTVESYEVSGGTPKDLRSFLQNLYNTENIEGALFIGDFPVAWFQIKNDFYEYGYAEWPIDLFYMDLDGDWFDTLMYDLTDTLIPGQDSVYDVHSGNLSPEIYVGRLTPTGIGDDILLIKNYLSKDNAYRHSSIELPRRALVYVDDDWVNCLPYWAQDVSLLYNDTLVVSDSNTTRASDYRVRLDTMRAWVSVFAHGWPGGHKFYYNDYSSYDYYYSSEYTTQDPPANFYNFFSCSFARYTEGDYGGGRAIFTDSYGVGGIGSTKTGGMLEFYYFYLPLSQGKTLGEAFKDWFTHIAQDGISFDELCWHYGMTLLGDPFLLPTGHNLPSPSCSLIVADAGGSPGSTDNPTSIELNNQLGVGGLQFTLRFNGSLLTADSVIATPHTSNMDIGYNTWSDSLKVLIYSISGDSISPGENAIIQVLFDVDDSAVLGDSTLLQLKDCVLSDPGAQPILCISQDGWFHFITSLTAPSLITPDTGSLISDNTPLFGWSDVTGATKYWLQVDNDSSFSSPMIDDSALVSSLYTPTTPLADALYYWRVCAGNRFEWSDWSSIWNFVVDTTSPVIDSTTQLQDTVDFWGPFTVDTKITDNFNIKDAVLHFRINNSEWMSDTMALTEGDWYTGVIPEQTPPDTLAIDYYITASDYANNLSRDPEDGNYSFKIFLTGIQETRDIPDRFVLFSPTPNPSLGMIKIQYGLPEKTNVSLQVYDIQGRLVKPIFSGSKDAGYYKLQINSKDLSSGIYFLRLESEKYNATRKLLIIR